MAAVDYLGFRWNPSHKFYNRYAKKGAVLFTGPDGIRDHKTKTLNARATGIGALSPEGTSDLDYVLRAARSTPHPRPTSVKVGAIGWDVTSLREDHVKLWKSGYQIKLRDFRLACELRHTHLYQNPWNPPPSVVNEQLNCINFSRVNENCYRPKQMRAQSTWPSISGNTSSTKIHLRRKHRPISLEIKI